MDSTAQGGRKEGNSATWVRVILYCFTPKTKALLLLSFKSRLGNEKVGYGQGEGEREEARAAAAYTPPQINIINQGLLSGGRTQVIGKDRNERVDRIE